MSLQSKILRFLEAEPHVWVVKVEVANFRGCPDILCCVEGRFLVVEAKSKGDKVSPIQAEQLRRICVAGGCSLVVWDFDEFKKLFIDFVCGG